MHKNQVGSHKRENGYEMVNVNIEDVGDKKLSPFLEAAKNGDVETLSSYLDKGEKILQVDETGGTCLHHAAYNEDFKRGIDCTNRIITRALQNSNPNILQDLLKIVDISNHTALGRAAFKGNAKLMEILLDNGILLGVSKKNLTIFHILAKLENHENAAECAEVLLNLKYFDNDSEKLRKYLNIEEEHTKQTALHISGIMGNAKLVKQLIIHGTDARKEDYAKSNVFHYVVGNAFEEEAVEITSFLLQEKLTPEWKKLLPNLLETFDTSERCPVHIVARRGFHKILGLFKDYYWIAEGKTGFTPLHAAASLGDEVQAELCVMEILSHADGYRKSELCDAEDSEGRTPLYLSAKEKNVEACKLLLLAGSKYDIKSKRGKTPLEKVYEKIPQAVSVLLDKAVKNSGYVTFCRTINTCAELDFAPILGYSIKENIYKETEELAKVCGAKFEDRKAVLNHPFVRIYIHEKWEKVKWFFHIFRFLHILWFFLNCIFVVWTYRYVCPIPGAKNFTWTGLRPTEEETENFNKTLSECEIPSTLRGIGFANLVTLFLYIICQFHHTKQTFHHFFRPLKSHPERNCLIGTLGAIGHYLRLVFLILPIGPIIMASAILITILPTLGIQPFDDFWHYFVAGMVGLGVWAAICLEAMKIPKFSVYKNLLWRSAKTLLIAITVTAPILLGFAALFAILIPAEKAFSSPAQSFVKVITFMIGELDYGNLVYEGTNSVFLGWVMLFMALFIVIIVVLLVNFLIGLAAEEISDVYDRAEIWSLCTKLEEIHSLESFLDDQITLCGRGFLRRNLMLMPPDREHGKNVKQRRQAQIIIPDLPRDLQKKFHQLKLKTIRQLK